jgi:DNA topoisomerase-1
VSFHPVFGAGVLLTTPDGRGLFLRRAAEKGDFVGYWDVPGGGAQPDEAREATALREMREEIGAQPYGEREQIAETRLEETPDFSYTTFRQPVLRPFTPRLCDEHDGYVWARLDSPPRPLHPGLEKVLGMLQQDGEGAQDAGEFKEEDHPRDEDGKFGSGGGGGAAVKEKPKANKAEVKWTMSGGEKPSTEQMARLKELKVPPAWTNIKLSADKNAALQVVGKDEKGRSQYLYSAEHSAKAAAEKFARLREFNTAAKGIVAKSSADMSNTALPQKTRDAAAITQLIAQTGFRIGSDANTGAEVKAHGASTLEGKHVKVKGDTLTFDFVGKKGVNIQKTLSDATLAAYINERKGQVGNGPLFEATDGDVRKYFHAAGGEGFKVKDFRTWNATNLALEEMAKPPPASTEAELKKKQSLVAKVVSAHLGNTPKVAVESYIDPAVWAYRGAQA